MCGIRYIDGDTWRFPGGFSPVRRDASNGVMVRVVGKLTPELLAETRS